MPAPRRVILTRQAVEDLESISRYIRQDSPQNAAAVAAIILQAIDSLATLSERFRCVGKSQKRGAPIYAMVVRPFII